MDYAICTMNPSPSLFTRLLHHRFVPLIALVLLTLILTYPTITTLTTHVIDRQDPLLNTWIMAWEANVLRGNGTHLFTTNIFYPLDNSLAFSEILLSTSLIVMPITWATDIPILSYNLVFLFAFFSTALGAYLLALYLTGNRGAALVAAVAFAWSPYRMGHLSQIQLLTFGWLPLAFIYLDRLLRGKGNTVRNGIVLGLFFVLQALASFYSALFGGIALLLYGIGWLLWQRRFPLRSLIGFIVAGVLVCLLVVPFTLPYFENQQALGAGWTLEDNERFSASLQAYGYAPEGTLFWGAITRPLAYTYGDCCPPDSLFPGLTLLGFSGFALWQARGGRRGLWIAIGGIAFVLSLGPTLTLVAGNPTDIALPYTWLYENAPFFNGLRAPVRWAVLVTLVLSLLAAVGIARWRWRWGWLVAFGLVLAEFMVLPLRVVPLPEPPDSLAWLVEQPQTRILEIPLVAELPRPDVEGEAWQEPRLAWEVSRLLEMQYFSTAHWHTTLDGYSGYIPARHGDYARELASLPSERAFLMLRGLGFKYLVVHEDELSEEAAARWQQPLPDGVIEVQRIGNERIIEISALQTETWDGQSEIAITVLPLTTTILIEQLPANTPVSIPLLLESHTTYVPNNDYLQPVYLQWVRSDGYIVTDTLSIVYPPVIEHLTLLPLSTTTPSEGNWTLSVQLGFPFFDYQWDNAIGWIEYRPSPIEAQPFIITTTTPTPTPDFLPIALEEVEAVGETTYRLTWQTYQPLMHDYSISVRLVDSTGNVLAQQDGAPGGDVPTSAWLAGDAYSAEFALESPQTGEELQLMVIWYDPTRPNGTRVWNGDTFVNELSIDN
jgi:hypothetical protein